MDFLLPSTTYQAPPRLGRGRPLNTIIETEDELYDGLHSDSEGDTSDNTIIGRPVGLDEKLASRSEYQQPRSYMSVDLAHQSSEQSSYAGSDAGTHFSEESCPSLADSLASDPTSFASLSSRNSVASTRSNRKQYPSLLIPRESWHSDVKEVTFGMSPATKIKLSPAVLSSLSSTMPPMNTPPAFGDSSSVASESRSVGPSRSVPATPELHGLEYVEGRTWGSVAGQGPIDTPLEIAVDDEHSILLSAREAHSDSYRSSAQFSDLMIRFPDIPGATPIEQTPITPNIDKSRFFGFAASDHGVKLPEDAFQVLQHLTRGQSPQPSEPVAREEMRECSVPVSRTHSRSQSQELVTPLSEYSYSDLSIPSPGGFFSSLQDSTRHTWGFTDDSKLSYPPSSTTAENFYSVPWNRPDQVVETVLECHDSGFTDEPPTVRQADFNILSPAKTVVLPGSPEDDDLYGMGHAREADEYPAPVADRSYEYEETYDSEIRNAAEANMDRTSHWLAAQTTYLTELRDHNPINDPAESPATPDPLFEEEEIEQSPAVDPQAHKAVRFLEEATKVTVPAVESQTAQSSPVSPNREPRFLDAFEHHIHQAGHQDAFLYAAPRWQSINAMRLALPAIYLQTLLNTNSSNTLNPHRRPKYRGPFNQRPRDTGIFADSPEQEAYRDAERQAVASERVLPHVWMVEAQRKLLFGGRLFACQGVEEMLNQKSGSPSDSPVGQGQGKTRVLDLGGAATGSWAWTVANKWPEAKVYTVQVKQQADLASVFDDGSNDETPYKPANPGNHRVVSVPHLWDLPFRTGHFDVVSARTLHMFLHSKPVPGVDNINEWEMTLKECMRVLKPGGVLDYFVLDSDLINVGTTAGNVHASITPTAAAGQDLGAALDVNRGERTAAEFSAELKRRGYERDGGCGQLMSRLRAQGFQNLKRQWVALPVGHMPEIGDNASSTRDTLYSESIRSSRFTAGRARRPSACHSTVSSISHIFDSYYTPPSQTASSLPAAAAADSEELGSTGSIADMAGLLGGMMWEEWFARLRIEMGRNDPARILDGVHELFTEGWSKGASFRGVVGWAKKPKPRATLATTSTPPSVPKAASPRRKKRMSLGRGGFGLTLQTSGLNNSGMAPAAGWDLKTADCSQSAIDRGEIGFLPMMIIEE